MLPGTGRYLSCGRARNTGGSGANQQENEHSSHHRHYRCPCGPFSQTGEVNRSGFGRDSGLSRVGWSGVDLNQPAENTGASARPGPERRHRRGVAAEAVQPALHDPYRSGRSRHEGSVRSSPRRLGEQAPARLRGWGSRPGVLQLRQLEALLEPAYAFVGTQSTVPFIEGDGAGVGAQYLQVDRLVGMLVGGPCESVTQEPPPVPDPVRPGLACRLSSRSRPSGRSIKYAKPVISPALSATNSAAPEGGSWSRPRQSSRRSSKSGPLKKLAGMIPA